MRYIETKTILSKLRTADRWFGIAYNMNLYRGCQHGCIYCDTRSDCYGIGDIAQIAVKRNALELLPAELRARRKKRATIGTGSMNDPYMPVERELRLTRRALGMIADERFPVHVITKSSLAERDADILQEISATYAAVSFTVTCADDALSVRTEPGAPASSERFRAMAALAAKGIYTGVTMMPLLPLINDTRENVEAIVRRAKDAGASYILPMFGVTLRSGSREHFHAALERGFPGLKARYEACFGNRYECFGPNCRALDDTFRTALTGDSKEYRESSSSLMFAFILAIVLIYLILAAQFESFKDPLIIMLTVPLAIAGALVFMYFGGITMNIFSQIGIIMLIGLVAKNGILIVEFANLKQETGEDKMTAIKDAALQRLRPILMTSASTILGLIPLAFASGEGCNQRIAMGTAVVGGMLVSTLLTMYIVPAIYSYISTNRSNKLKQE